MISEKIRVFRTIPELQQFLELRIVSLKTQADDLSKVIGEKLRRSDPASDGELLDLKSKLEGGAVDPKKKKNPAKKDQKTKWYSLEAVSIYDEIGLKGDLDLHFKALEETKSDLERVTKVKQTVDDLMGKGIKKELGCVFVMNHILPAEIAFVKSADERKRFNYRAVFNVPVET